MFDKHLNLLGFKVLDTLRYMVEQCGEDVYGESTYAELHHEMIPWTLAHASSLVFGSILSLAQANQSISVAVLSRSLIEGMASINWLHEDCSDINVLRTKTKKLYDQAEKVYKLTGDRSFRKGSVVTYKLKEPWNEFLESNDFVLGAGTGTLTPDR